jgi:hypothetical protein
MIFFASATLIGYAQTPTTYRLTIDWSYRDMDGKIMSHKVASGNIEEVSRQSFIQNVNRLEDWTLTNAGEQGRGIEKIEELDGLEFEISWDNFTKLDFYKDFPPAHVDLIRWIVQDKVAFDAYGGDLDSLQLNIPIIP